MIIDPNSNELRGIIEIKSIKALRSKTIDEWIKNGGPSNACVSFISGKLLLKRYHSYYYQIQLQLLITEAPFCDFILHSKIGPPYVKPICPDIQLQQKIGPPYVKPICPDIQLQQKIGPPYVKRICPDIQLQQKIGPPYVKRICPDIQLQQKIGPPYVKRRCPDIQLQQKRKKIQDNSGIVFCTRIFHTKREYLAICYP